MVIQWEPIHADVPYLRADFNPAYAEMEQVYGILSHVLPGGIEDLWLKATITRFDAALDIEDVLPHQLMAYYPKKQVTQIHCKSGRIETLYLGDGESDNRVVIYDKALEVKAKNKKYHLSLPIPTTDTTRVEIRLKPKMGLSALKDLDNPFQPLVLRQKLLLPKKDKGEVWRLFVALIQFRGVQDALALLNESTSKGFKAVVKETPSSWWKPDVVWQDWHGLLMKTFMLPSLAGGAAE